jgi:hypothetical protein
MCIDSIFGAQPINGINKRWTSYSPGDIDELLL